MAQPDRRRLGVVFWMSAAWVGLLVALALLAPVLGLRDPEELGIRTREVARYEGPGANAWFGGDEQGRDLFSNVVWAVRPALLIGVLATAISATLGTLAGVTAGYLKGRVDTVTMALVDTALAFPALIALAALLGTTGASVWTLIGALAVLGIPPYARIVRGVTLAVAEREFVDAARSMGATNRRIILSEILPNVLMAVLSFAFLGFAIVIATEGALAFIGLSIDQTTWGSLIASGARQIRDASHLALFPATAMFLTILAFNFIGDSLRALADPRPVATATVRRRATTEGRVDPADGLVSIRDLHTTLHTERGEVAAVSGVDLELAPGERLGIVGESGSGKTMLLRSIVGVFPVPSVERTGALVFDDTDLLTCDDGERRRILGTEIGMISQNPLAALTPVRRIGSQLVETMRVHTDIDRASATERAAELLESVGIADAERRMRQYPFQLSGGLRQRVTIAIALANSPRLLLADEPTTALDVTVQDQILRLLAETTTERDMALILVTHDLAVVESATDRVAVMYAGRVVEEGPTALLLAQPRHRYTEALLSAIPRFDGPTHTVLPTIDGQPPSLIDPPAGCAFAARCAHADETCRTKQPPMTTITQRAGDESQLHRAACWHPAGADPADPDSVPAGTGTGSKGGDPNGR